MREVQNEVQGTGKQHAHIQKTQKEVSMARKGMGKKTPRGFSSRKYHKHHRVPTSRGGDKKDLRNISLVPRNLHEAYHAFAGNLLPHELAKVLNTLWIDPDVELVALTKGKEADLLKEDARLQGILNEE